MRSGPGHLCVLSTAVTCCPCALPTMPCASRKRLFPAHVTLRRIETRLPRRRTSHLTRHRLPRATAPRTRRAARHVWRRSARTSRVCQVGHEGVRSAAAAAASSAIFSAAASTTVAAVSSAAFAAASIASPFQVLNDLFALSEACLLADVVQLAVDASIPFDPSALGDDVSKAIQWVHMSGDIQRLRP